MNERSPTAPGAWYAWYVVAVLSLANVSANVDQQILSLLVGPIKRDLGITDSQFSYLSGLAFAVFYSLLGLPIARLADRSNRRNLMASGVGLWSVFTALCATAHTYGTLFLFRLGVGVGEATLNAPSVSLLADYFPRERLGRAMSVFSLGIFLGSGAAYFIGAWAVGALAGRDAWHVPVIGLMHPWQSVFLAVGLPGVLIALLILTIREPPRTASARVAVPYSAVWRYASANARTFTTYGLGFTASAAVNLGIAVWLNQFLVRTHGWSVPQAGRVQGILTMTVGVGGALAGGWLVDALTRRGYTDAPVRVGMIGAVGMLVAATAYPLVGSSTSAVAWLAVVNVFAALPWGGAATGMAEMVPGPLRAQAAALFFLVQGLVSRTLGPASVAWITDYGFHDPLALRYSLAIANVFGMLLTLGFLAAGLGAYRRTLAYRDAWTP